MADYTDIQIPVGGQPASSSLFGVKVRDYIIDLNSRVTPLETSNQRIVKRGRRTTPTGAITTVETGVLRVDNIPVVAGGIYRISTSNINMDTTVANDIGTVRCRVATGPLNTAATTASAQIGQMRDTLDDATNSNVTPLQCFYVATADTYLSVLLSAVRVTGTGNLVIFCSSVDILDLTIEFAGADPGNTGVVL
jgi:hypothetical protein